MKEKNEILAIFWCSLLHDAIFEEVDAKQLHRHLSTLSQADIRFPNGITKKPSLSTLQRKLRQYSQGGLEALYRKIRNDRGKPRAVSQEIIDKAVAIKSDQAQRCADTINHFLLASHRVTVARSTLYRHLKARGATRLKLGIVQEKVRCRWTREHPNELWIGDFSHGPYVLVDNNVAQSYLCLFIDCHSRYVVEGRYYLHSSLDILVDSLLRAWSINGLPNELYLDNAKVYHSHALKAACYSLKIKLLHRPVHDPAPGGLIESLFGTNQKQFETEVRAGDILTLYDLNKGFAAWLSVVYHQRIHSETKKTPAALYQPSNRRISIDDANKFFMQKVTRRVHRDFSDVSINAGFYLVPPKFRGDNVIVRFDQFSVLDKVSIYSLLDEFLAVAPRYHRERGAHQQQQPAPSSKKTKFPYLELIRSQHEQSLQQQALGIDYTKLSAQHLWSFPDFLHSLARLMGKKEGHSAFNAQELELLKKLYDIHSPLTPALLTEAFTNAEIKNLSHLTYQLQLLHQQAAHNTDEHQ